MVGRTSEIRHEISGKPHYIHLGYFFRQTISMILGYREGHSGSRSLYEKSDLSVFRNCNFQFLREHVRFGLTYILLSLYQISGT
jgi:hypothetical protein